MIAVVQRCSRGEVRVGGDRVGALGERGGLVVLLGVETGDTIDHARKMGDKLIKLRIFEDGDGKMNLAVAEVGGSILVISQFTLAGDCSGGNRPSFVRAARPEAAEPLVNEVVARIAESGLVVETGRFRTEMKVDILNDGPVTLIVRVG
ncbi:MAG: D-tyrosyl-tRNA(Tyr) deacylase [Planctomycetota bacterium]|nr:MAG: D-tyrosyl-tRNA(Tyr) deacylase [Planctomycetota bacterium]RLT00144.1 MAG: D-tyrosyl-tRNA(Tyr) deacylase [Planctomycetota bacterium]